MVMTMNPRPRKTACSVALFSAAAAGATYLAAPGAEALPPPQGRCFHVWQTVAQNQGVVTIDGTPTVVVDNGSARRYVVVTLNVDANVSAGEMRVSYKVDNVQRSEYEFGAGNLANHVDYDMTRTNVALMLLGPGVHTVTPTVRISGNVSDSGHITNGCLIA